MTKQPDIETKRKSKDLHALDVEWEDVKYLFDDLDKQAQKEPSKFHFKRYDLIVLLASNTITQLSDKLSLAIGLECDASSFIFVDLVIRRPGTTGTVTWNSPSLCDCSHPSIFRLAK